MAIETRSRGLGRASRRVLFARGFRPFFLLAGLQGALAPLLWVGALAGWFRPPAWLDAVAWHAHEMLFGLVAAAMAGFLLTAVPVWSGKPPVRGARLAALAGLWLLGRAAMAAAGELPPALVAALDLAFLPALLAALSPPLLAPSQRRNRGFLAVLAALAVANLLVHLRALGFATTLPPRLGLHLAVEWVAIALVVIGGRITPLFTANALRRIGVEPRVRPRPQLGKLAVAACLLVVLGEIVGPRSRAQGLAELAAGGLLLARLSGWQAGRVWRDPLVASLHVGYAWCGLGFLLMGLADVGGPLPWTAGLHALTAGAFGAMVLAVMTRVALGHTGRPLVAPRGATLAYLLVSLGAVGRVLGPMLFPSRLLPLLVVSGALWAGAFVAFLASYVPILLAPRVDGRAE